MTAHGEIEGGGASEERPVVYCLIPADLAARLHDPLRRHFRDDPGIEVVVERRRRERRSGKDRRESERRPPADVERRQIRGSAGRRIGERRAALVPVDEAPPLPRRARRYADRITFVERLEPRTERAEDLDTARLVTRIQAGEGEAFATLYTRYFDRVYGYLRVALRDHHEAEDIAQQVFVQLFEALPRYEPRRPFGAWLFTIVRNEAIDHLRKSGRLDVVDPAELARRRENDVAEDAGLRALSWISDRDLLLFVERLPLPQRQVIVMRFVLDLSAAQIAEVLERTPSDVRRLQHRALRFLEKRLAAVGRTPERRERAGMLQRTKPANILRRRRTSLLGG